MDEITLRRYPTYLNYLNEQYGVPDDNGMLLPFFGLNGRGELTAKSFGFPPLSIQQVVDQFGAVQLLIPQIAGVRADVRSAVFQRIRQQIGYEGDITNSYATKANDHYQIVRQVLAEGDFLETSSPAGLRTVPILRRQELVGGSSLVISNGFFNDLYLDEIFLTIREQQVNLIPVLDKPFLLDHFIRAGHSVKFGVRQRAKVGAITPKELDESESRFGMTLDEIKLVANRVVGTPSLELVMYHFHLGSQILDEDLYVHGVLAAARNYCNLARYVPTLKYLNIGGGAPVQYSLSGLAFNHERAITRILKGIISLCEEYRVPQPHIITEWGRHTVAEAEIHIFDAIKAYRGYWQVDDTIMGSVPDTWALGQPFPVLPVSGYLHKPHNVRIAGLTCDEDDVYSRYGADGWVRPDGLVLPKAHPSRENPFYLAFMHTGAYQSNLGTLEHCMQTQEGVIMAMCDGEQWHYTTLREPQTINGMLATFGWPV